MFNHLYLKYVSRLFFEAMQYVYVRNTLTFKSLFNESIAWQPWSPFGFIILEKSSKDILQIKTPPVFHGRKKIIHISKEIFSFWWPILLKKPNMQHFISESPCCLSSTHSLCMCPLYSEPGKVEKGFDCSVLHAVSGPAGPFHRDALQGQAR